MAAMLGVIVVTVLLTVSIIGNPGREFIVTFPQNDQTGELNPILLTPFYKADSSIQVTITGANTNYSDDVTLLWGNPKNYQVPPSFRLAQGSHVTGNQTLLIQSTHLITVMIRSKGFSNMDAYLAIPVSQLGTRYVGFSYTPDAGANEIAASFVVITALSHPTTGVTVTLPPLPERTDTLTHRVTLHDVTYLPGDVIHIDLDPHESLQLQALYDLTGTMVQSTRPVAFWSGVNRTGIDGGACRSHMLQMLPPTTGLGTRFVLVPLPVEVPLNIYRVVALEWFTCVTLYPANSSGHTHILPRPGSYVTYRSTNGVAFEYVVASKPVSVARYSASQTAEEGGDSALTVLIPLDSVNRTYYRVGQATNQDRPAIYTVVIHKDSLGSVTWDDDPITNVSNPSLTTVVSVHNVTMRDDLLALVIHVITDKYFTTFVIEGDSPLLVYADYIVVTCEGEAFPLAYPDVEGVQPLTTDATNIHCLALDGNNATSMYFKDSYTTDGCCIQGDQVCQCKVSKSDNQCQMLPEYRQASSNTTVASPSLLACRHKCQSRSWCLGVNYAPDLPVTSSPNCQLLWGEFQGLRLDGVWQFLHCFTVATFITTNCTTAIGP